MVGLTPEHEPEQASKQLGDREGTPTGPITLSVHTLQLEPPNGLKGRLALQRHLFLLALHLAGRVQGLFCEKNGGDG
jgi:hypothetical protein